MLYSSISRGFKAGGYNLIPTPPESFDPEIVLAYEVGMKSLHWNGRIQSSLSAFYYDYKDLQVNQTEGFATAVKNAAKATIQGSEIDLRIKLTESIKAHTSVAYLSAKYDRFFQQTLDF